MRVAAGLCLVFWLVECAGFAPRSTAGTGGWRLAQRLACRVTETVPLLPDGKQRIDVFLSSILPARSRSFLGDLCDKGSVTVNDRVVTKSYKVASGDVISYAIQEKEVSRVTPENIPLDILYEDDDIIAVNKPHGMVVHPAPGSPNATFVNALLFHLGPSATRLLDDLPGFTAAVVAGLEEPDYVPGKESESGPDVDLEAELDLDLPETPEAAVASHVSLRPGVVHRLDKGTSGVLLAGKHPEAVAKLMGLFAARKVSKIYLAVCVGHPGEATIVEPIGRSVKNRQLMTVYDGPPGKPAVTHVRTLAFDGKLSVALVRIETGRTHQIRVHLKERRTPIAGDEAYGNPEWNRKLARSDAVFRPLLHAYETVIEHPFTGKQLVIRAPLPKDFSDILRKLSPADPLLDAHSLLTVPTDVAGKGPGEQGKGFVPMDRLVLKEEEWTSWELPEVQT